MSANPVLALYALSAALLVPATAPSKTGALAYFGAFVAARLLHSFFYLFGRQPFRTLSFVVGVLAVVGMAIHVIRFYA